MAPVDYGLYLELVTVSLDACWVIPRAMTPAWAHRVPPHMAARGTVPFSQQ